MKKLSKLALMTSLAMGATFLPAQAALDTTYNANDILFGFRAATGQGNDVTLIFNLGAASIYRDTTSNILNIANIGTNLSTAYNDGGTAWDDRINLWAGFVSATNGINIDDSGGTPIASQTTDYNSTIYVSTRRTAIGTVGSANSTRPGNSIPLDAVTFGSAVGDLGGTFSTYQSGGIFNRGTGDTNTWNSYVTGSGSADFLQYNVEAAFTATDRGTFGAAGTVEQIWDFYRVANFPNTDADSGKGIYQGSFTIDNSGNISFIAVPEPNTIGLLLAGLGFAGWVSRRRASRESLS